MKRTTFSNKIGAKGREIEFKYKNYYDFHPRTKDNLNKLTFKHGIIWNLVKVTPVNIQLSYSYSANSFRVGLDIKVFGINKNGEQYMYHRHEPGGIAAGKTILYKNGKKPIQVSKAILMSEEELNDFFNKKRR